ncbi:NUDIX hydrolase [Lottiidibacillus patelloidae]|uniref:NUDIX hydrolase n=1 Tax=Lottiidibacillus patelloidae TaxID=2670334 RepID=A0A263BPR6_9BACI|nr:NUDIX domain-containing protein [Lottiidibacillus patelloidae]OZM55750.1 NUDIX hydrolase [Lottiidibacillus patelloidae]
MLKREHVWLGVSGIVECNGRWLVVKKAYSGLKGKWSFPAGFVDPGETVDQAVVREIKEETGVKAKIKDIIGVRSGVIKNKISDNLILFYLEADCCDIKVSEREIETAAFLTREELINDINSSLLVKEYAQSFGDNEQFVMQDLNPGDHFNYTRYKLFKK